MTRSLPSDPSLEFDRKQAKNLLAALRAGEPAALQRFVDQHPQFEAAADPRPLIASAGLHDAQLVVAREYGLPSWRALVEKIESIELQRFREAIERRDVEKTRQLLQRSESLRAHVNDPLFHFGRRAVHVASDTPPLMDVLLQFGGDINLRSDWENGPYTVLDECPEHVARQLIARGAKLTAHAAARFGWIDELRAMIDADPNVVHEKGGDGQRPLHYAKTSEIVDLLLERGADIDARCVDHHSTAAQYAVVERPDICRYLLARGATADIFMPAVLDDPDLANRLIDEDANCLAARINAPGYAPVPPFNTYCWSLGWWLSPHEVALKFQHQDTYELFLQRSSEKVRFLIACSRADEPAARAVLRDHPQLVEQLSPSEQALLPFSMFYNRTEAVKLMLELEFDISARGIEGGTLLHTAAWQGNAEIVARLLRESRDRIDLEQRDPTHNGTPLGWAIHGSLHSPNCRRGDYAEVVRLLLAAGSKPPDTISGGSDAVNEVLRQHGLLKSN